MGLMKQNALWFRFLCLNLVLFKLIISLLEVDKVSIIKKSAAGKKKYSIANKPCNKCNGLISWDGLDKDNPTPPIHVDENGFLIDDGSCPANIPEY